MNLMNYKKELNSLIEKLKKSGEVPSLLLHSCCAPCSSYVLEYLSSWFEITVYYYNPNIYPEEEYFKRVNEQIRFVRALNFDNKISFMQGGYDTESYYKIAKGKENEKEGGERCFECYELRLRETAKAAKDGGFDFFTTTLSVSPHKNAAALNEIGGRLSDEYGVKYLYSDFKKNNGYKRSLELSRQYNLYRQDYCGCIYSM